MTPKLKKEFQQSFIIWNHSIRKIWICGILYNYFIPYCATAKTIIPRCCGRMTPCNVAWGRWPRATVPGSSTTPRGRFWLLNRKVWYFYYPTQNIRGVIDKFENFFNIRRWIRRRLMKLWQHAEISSRNILTTWGLHGVRTNTMTSHLWRHGKRASSRNGGRRGSRTAHCYLILCKLGKEYARN